VSLTLYAWLAGCSDPRDALLPDDASAWTTDAGFREAWGELDLDEQARLDAFRERYRPGGPMGDGGWIARTSIRRALDEQARFEAQAAQAQAQEAAEAAAHAARVDALRAIVDLRLVDVAAKAAWREGERSQLYATFRVENRGDAAVVAFKGEVVVSQGPRPLAEIPVLVSERIGARSGADWRYDFDVDPTSATQEVLVTTAIGKLGVVWNPERIDLADGTIVALE
jgi:hypothetical protein